jgi:hypothetical protein
MVDQNEIYSSSLAPEVNNNDVEVPPDVLDSIMFGEDIKIDWRKYPKLHRKCWDMQKTEAE